MQWGLVGFHLGNAHCVSFFQPEAIVVPYDHTLEALLRELRVPVRREHRPLAGIPLVHTLTDDALQSPSS